MLKVDISDSGIGLSKEQIARLFQPFTQAEESTTRKFGGTGLGLTISQQLAKLLGGKIVVQSQLNQGSTFSLRVDMGPAGVTRMISDFSQVSTTANTASGDWQEIPLRGRILLAEDGRDNQRLISSHLRASGAQVVIAENGKLALDLVARETFDLILMDMQMPVMDGYTATAAIRAGGFTVPIIALTAFAMAEDRSKCTTSGCTDYLSKPIDRKLLLTTVQQYMNPSTSARSSKEDLQGSNSVQPAGDTITSSLLNYPGMKDIILEFVEGLPTQVQTIHDCIERNDLQELCRVIHQLRGAGGGYGFDQVTEPATRAEHSIRTQCSLDAIKAEVDSLIKIIERIDGFDARSDNPGTTSGTEVHHGTVSGLHRR